MSAAGDNLRRVADRAGNQGGRAAARAMGKQGEIEVSRQLVKRTHGRGTPTPSPPGQPPAKISGDLADSVKAETPVSAGAYRWVTEIGGHTVYARIQGMGGVAGRNHATTLPPRPYLLPAYTEGWARITAEGRAAFQREVLG